MLPAKRTHRSAPRKRNAAVRFRGRNGSRKSGKKRHLLHQRTNQLFYSENHIEQRRAMRRTLCAVPFEVSPLRVTSRGAVKRKAAFYDLRIEGGAPRQNISINHYARRRTHPTIVGIRYVEGRIL